MKRFSIVALLLFSLIAVPSNSFSGGQDQAEKDKKAANVWMKAKAGYSKEILVGLTEGDFDKIKANATSLNVVHFRFIRNLRTLRASSGVVLVQRNLEGSRGRVRE